MDWLEEELKRALARENPPRELLRRRVRAPKPVYRWLAAAAALIAVSGASVGWREYRGRVASQEVRLALRIAGAKTARIQTQIKEITQ